MMNSARHGPAGRRVAAAGDRVSEDRRPAPEIYAVRMTKRGI